MCNNVRHYTTQLQAISCIPYCAILQKDDRWMSTAYVFCAVWRSNLDAHGLPRVVYILQGDVGQVTSDYHTCIITPYSFSLPETSAHQAGVRGKSLQAPRTQRCATKPSLFFSLHMLRSAVLCYARPRVSRVTKTHLSAWRRTSFGLLSATSGSAPRMLSKDRRACRSYLPLKSPYRPRPFELPRALA